MEKIESGLVIIGMLFIVVFIVAVRRKTECIINFVFRMILGTIIIYFTNSILNYYGIKVSVVINPISILISGFLGIPGITVLYGINYFIV